ncbi:MAG: alpha-hydroxy acid oxidase [Maritimibacter sp.]
MRLSQCHNFHDFRELARRRLPGPIFNYIDGGADDEATLRHNSAAFDRVDLLPHVLRGSEEIDLSVEVMGQKLDLPFYLSPTALQRLFHHDGERAVAAAASKNGTMFGVSSLGTVSLEELRKKYSTPQVYQFYFHKDRGLNKAMMQRAKEAGVDVMMLTVDSMTGGNRERDKRTGFSIPMKLTLRGMMEFALKPAWGINYVTHEKFSLPQLDEHVDLGGGAMSIGSYFTEMLDPTMNWDDLAFDELGAIVDAVGDDLDVIMDSGIQRGTHIIKALSMGAKAVGVGRAYLFPLAAAGQAGVERMVELMREELIRDMRLMGAAKISDLNRDNLRFR